MSFPASPLPSLPAVTSTWAMMRLSPPGRYSARPSTSPSAPSRSSNRCSAGLSTTTRSAMRSSPRDTGPHERTRPPGRSANRGGECGAMTKVMIPSGPLQGVKLEVAERRWSRTRLFLRATAPLRRRRRRRPAG